MEPPFLMREPQEVGADADIVISRPQDDVSEENLSVDVHQSMLDRTRSAVWPLALAVGIGLAVGFAGGYGTASRDGEPPPALEPTTVVAAAARPLSAATPPESEAASREPGIVAASPPPAPTTVPSVVRGSDAPPLANMAPSRGIAKAARAPAPPPRVVPVEGRLLVRSTPAGATVIVNGRTVGATPLTIRGVNPGRHSVHVSRSGYVAQERQVSIDAERPAQSVSFDLAPAIATLFVDSRPVGAYVFVDDRLIGTTPLLLDRVPEGSHAVRLERDGYRRWVSSVRIVAGRNRVTASLER
jgi:hypothetical protein